MSHVDEGTLHAYLDGGLPPVEAGRVRTHLEACPACRSRLEEERQLVERANRLLERVAPPLSGRAIPGFDALVPRSRRRLPYVPLAWAATLFLAVGLGWYLRGMPGRPTEIATVQSPPAAPPVDAPPSVRGGGEPTTFAAPAPRNEVAARPSNRRDVRKSTPGEVVAEQAAKSKIDTAPVVNAAPSPALEASSATGQAAANPIVPRDEVASRAPAADRAAPSAAARPQAQVSGASMREEWIEVSADSARALLGGKFATIPGLAISRIQKSRERERVVLVTFTPDSRTTIQLYEQVAESDQTKRAKTSQVEAFTQRMARYVAGLRVEITGTVGADSLNRLLEAVR